MAQSIDINPASPHHLPSFITAPGQTDVLMVIMGIFLAVAILMFGILFLRLHTLPERVAHKSKKIQFEIVAVLGLIALFTHMHIFWVIGLLLALVDFPDFGNMMSRIAGSVEKIAGVTPADAIVAIRPKEPLEATPVILGGDSHGRTAAPPTAAGFDAAGQKEAGHA